MLAYWLSSELSASKSDDKEAEEAGGSIVKHADKEEHRKGLRGSAQIVKKDPHPPRKKASMPFGWHEIGIATRVAMCCYGMPTCKETLCEQKPLPNKNMRRAGPEESRSEDIRYAKCSQNKTIKDRSPPFSLVSEAISQHQWVWNLGTGLLLSSSSLCTFHG